MSKVPPSSADFPTVEGFLKTVLRSRLLDRDQLQETLRDVPKEQREDPSALAEHLVRKGKLSRFQAGKILRSLGKGLLLGHFQVLAPIGRGGMGTVYLARDERSGELVALKLLPPQPLAQRRALAGPLPARDGTEPSASAHPHLAWTYESGVCQRRPLPRHGVHPRQEPVPRRRGRRPAARCPAPPGLMAEVASGLEHAHNQGLIHRDLKPSNIMVTPNDHAKVLDLGLALMQRRTGE